MDTVRMRATAAPNLTRFVRRVHRRLVVLRLLECAGVGVVCASALSIVLLPVFILRAKPALPVVAILLAAGATIGSIWLLLRRPRILDAAGEADRQLGLADLFATAWLIARGGEGGARDPFAHAVLLMAEGHAAALSPSSVALNRLGARAWTGVGLACALTVALALLSANPIVLRAAAPKQRAVANATMAATDTNSRAGESRGSRSMPIVGDHPDQEEEGFNPARRTTRTIAQATDSSTHTEVADPSGVGGGAGGSRARVADRSFRNASSTAANPNLTSSTPGDGGGGVSSGGNVGGNGVSGISAGTANTARQTPAWATSAWSAVRSAADTAVRSGSVPAQYHDLVRSYFDREGVEP